jgi:hypothetical protein
MKKSKVKPTLTDVLKAAIVDSEKPLLTLEQETGVKRASIMRFMRGESSLRLDIADKLALYFSLTLVPEKASTTKGK